MVRIVPCGGTRTPLLLTPSLLARERTKYFLHVQVANGQQCEQLTRTPTAEWLRSPDAHRTDAAHRFPKEMLSSIWTPGINYEHTNGNIEDHDASYWWLLPSGRVWHWRSVSLNMACTMDFHNMPQDVHDCVRSSTH